MTAALTQIERALNLRHRFIQTRVFGNAIGYSRGTRTLICFCSDGIPGKTLNSNKQNTPGEPVILVVGVLKYEQTEQKTEQAQKIKTKYYF